MSYQTRAVKIPPSAGAGSRRMHCRPTLWLFSAVAVAGLCLLSLSAVRADTYVELTSPQCDDQFHIVPAPNPATRTVIGFVASDQDITGITVNGIPTDAFSASYQFWGATENVPCLGFRGDVLTAADTPIDVVISLADGSVCDQTFQPDPQTTAELEGLSAAAPTDSALRLRLANAYAWQANYVQAEPIYREVIRVRPDFVMAPFFFGTTLLAWGHDDDALVEFGLCLDLEPDFVLAYYGRGDVWRHRGGHDDEADRAYREGLRFNHFHPGHPYGPDPGRFIHHGPGPARPGRGPILPPHRPGPGHPWHGPGPVRPGPGPFRPGPGPVRPGPGPVRPGPVRPGPVHPGPGPVRPGPGPVRPGPGPVHPGAGTGPVHPGPGPGPVHPGGGTGPVRPGPGPVHPGGGTGPVHPGGGTGTSHPSGGTGPIHPGGGTGTSHPSGGTGTSHPSGGTGISHPSGGTGTYHPSGGTGTSHPSGGTGTYHPSPGPSTSHPSPSPSPSHPSPSPGVGSAGVKGK